MTNSWLLLVLNWNMSVRFEVQIQRRIDRNLMIVIVAFQRVEVSVLWQSGSLVVEESRNAVWSLDFVLGLDNQITILDAHVNLRRINALWYVETHRYSLAAIFGVDYLWEQVLVRVFLGLLEWHFDDQLTVRCHERDQLGRFRMWWQVVGLLELFH